jgi:hypothetical protein
MRTEKQTDKDRRTDEQTDMTKLIIAFRKFAKAPKNGSWNTLQERLRL